MRTPPSRERQYEGGLRWKNNYISVCLQMKMNERSSNFQGLETVDVVPADCGTLLKRLKQMYRLNHFSLFERIKPLGASLAHFLIRATRGNFCGWDHSRNQTQIQADCVFFWARRHHNQHYLENGRSRCARPSIASVFRCDRDDLQGRHYLRLISGRRSCWLRRKWGGSNKAKILSRTRPTQTFYSHQPCAVLKATLFFNDSIKWQIEQ